MEELPARRRGRYILVYLPMIITGMFANQLPNPPRNYVLVLLMIPFIFLTIPAWMRAAAPLPAFNERQKVRIIALSRSQTVRIGIAIVYAVAALFHILDLEVAAGTAAAGAGALVGLSLGGLLFLRDSQVAPVTERRPTKAIFRFAGVCLLAAGLASTLGALLPSLATPIRIGLAANGVLCLAASGAFLSQKGAAILRLPQA